MLSMNEKGINELTEEEIYYKSDSTFGGRFNSFDEFIEWCKQQKK